MVDGININSPRLSGPGEKNEVVSKAAAESNSAPKIQKTQEVNQIQRADVSSVISKSAERRLDSLTSGNLGDFLKAAEKFIEASLPNKPPGTRLRIDLDDVSGRFVYQGVDINTGDVITQFPSEDILKLIAFNRERDGIEGIVVDEEA